MRRTQARDCRTLPFRPAEVFGVLRDISNYACWWPPELGLRVLRLSPELVGSRIEVHPPGGRFIGEVAQVIPERKILTHYLEGVHRGTGLWTVEDVPGGTRLCYRIDLEPQGLASSVPVQLHGLRAHALPTDGARFRWLGDMVEAEPVLTGRGVFGVDQSIPCLRTKELTHGTKTKAHTAAAAPPPR
jgi:hypothetical protein